jgi:hypothetical protein
MRETTRTTVATAPGLEIDWRWTLVFGGVMGLALMLADGMRFPGHRSFVYMFGFGVGLSFLNRASLLTGAGIAGLCHLSLRLAANWQSPSLESLDAVASPLGVAAVLGLVAARLPHGGRSPWFIPCATVVCWLVPLFDATFDWMVQDESWLAVAFGSPKAFVSHPVMGTLGAALAYGVRRGRTR